MNFDRKAYQREYQKARRIKARAQGKCTVCFVKAAAIPLLFCVQCNSVHNKDNSRKRLKHVHGLTTTAYTAMLAAQNGVCAICLKARPGHARLFVDHCHATGLKRGLLCGACNTFLGRIGDDPRLANRAVAYLEQGKIELAA